MVGILKIRKIWIDFCDKRPTKGGICKVLAKRSYYFDKVTASGGVKNIVLKRVTTHGAIQQLQLPCLDKKLLLIPGLEYPIKKGLKGLLLWHDEVKFCEIIDVNKK